MMLLLLGCASTPDAPDAPDAPVPVDTASDSDALSLVSLSAEPLARTVLGQRLSLTLSRAAAVSLRCADDDRPEEVHTASADAASAHTLDLLGLLADSAYTCAVTAEGAELGGIGFATGALPSFLPALSAEGSPGWGSYTLLNHFSGAADAQQKLLIVDPQGRVRWYWLLDLDVQEGVEAIHIGGGEVLTAGGMGLPPTIVTPTGEVRYRGADASSGGPFHHDVGLLPSGDILGLAEGRDSLDGASWTGFLVESRDPETGTLTGEWSSQVAVDAGQLPPAVGEAVDPYHANAVDYVSDDDGEALLLSLSGTDQLVRLDMDSGELAWRLGAGGDFALLDEAGAPIEGGWFNGQHGPHWDLPLVTLYDNRGLGQQSRALQLHLDTEAMTARIVWQWTEEGWYETVWGGVDVLEGGSVLIARGHCSFCPTADISLPTEVTEVDPATDAVLWRLVFPTREDGLYRAERLAGCAIFANAAYCPEQDG